MTDLSKLLETFYRDNSRYETVPPLKMIQGLETNKLILSDMEISDEDIPILIRFLRTKAAMKYVTQIEVNRTSGVKVNKRRSMSALNANGAKLFRELIHFVQDCGSLEVMTFESVEISPVMAGSICRALVDHCTELRWLMFRDCDIDGDKGFKAMAPYLGRMHLQVLGLECCNLTDASMPYICSFLKAQECNSDALFWNATLRMDPYMEDQQRIREETGFVYSQGLVAFSLFGNRLTGNGLTTFLTLIRKNHWLLGLNLAENKLEEEHIAALVKEMEGNPVLQAVLLRNNPGLTCDLSTKLYRSVFAKMQTSTNAAGQTAFTRLNLLVPRVSWMLKSWMRLQCEETRDLITAASTHQLNNSLLSANGNGSVAASGYQDRSFLTISTQRNTMISRVSRSPRRQKELEQQILHEEAKEYSVFAYLEPHHVVTTSTSGATRSAMSEAHAHQNESILYDLDVSSLPLTRSFFPSPLATTSTLETRHSRYPSAHDDLAVEDFEHRDAEDERKGDQESDDDKEEEDAEENRDFEYTIPGTSPPRDKKHKTSHEQNGQKHSTKSKAKTKKDVGAKKKGQRLLGDEEGDDAGGLWSHWPVSEEEYANPRNSRSLSNERPPSRISIRPRPSDHHLFSSAATTPTTMAMTTSTTTPRSIASAQRIDQRHSQVRARLDVKDVDLESNKRYVPHYMIDKHAGQQQPLEADGDEAGIRRIQNNHAQQSRSKSPPWRPSFVYHPTPAPSLPSNNRGGHATSSGPSPTASRMYRHAHEAFDFVPRSPSARSALLVQHRHNLTTGASATTSNGQKKKTATTKATKQKANGATKRPKTRKKASNESNMDNETARALSISMTSATQRLEQVSRQLMQVAESLSESMQLNQSHISGLATAAGHHLPPTRSSSGMSPNSTASGRLRPHTRSGGGRHRLYDEGDQEDDEDDEYHNHSNGHDLNDSALSTSFSPRSSGSQDHNALADMVRARMQIHLQRLLSQQLAATSASAPARAHTI